MTASYSEMDPDQSPPIRDRRPIKPEGIKLWDPGQELTVEWSQLHVKAKLPKRKVAKDEPPGPTHKVILNGVDGVATPGSLTALMGASGAGKTTLLNVLNRTGIRHLEVGGTITVNGESVTPTLMSRISGFVQQEDLFMGTLRVREHLLFHANLRMKGSSKQEKKDKIEWAMKTVGLKKCEESIIGIPGELKGISGGEAKRLSFASELLTDPMIVFCDEPTSGLDSFMAQNVIGVLKAMAASGRTIVATIHQPSSEIFIMFNDLYIMGEGKLCFAGSITDSAQFFESEGFPCPPNYNLADHLIHTLAIVPGEEEARRQRVQDISSHFATSVYGKKHKNLMTNVAVTTKKHVSEMLPKFQRNAYYTGPCNQIKWLMYRSLKRVSRDPYYIGIKLIEALVLGFFLGALFFRTKFDENVMCSICFDMVYGSVERFPLDVPMMNRDRTTGLYSPTIFYISQVIMSVITGFMLVLLRITVTYWMVGFRMKEGNGADLFVEVFLIYEVVMQTATAYGYLVSCLGGKLSTAIALANPFMLIPLLFAGFFIAKKSIPTVLSWICYTSFLYYGFESVSILIWRRVPDVPMPCGGNMTMNYEELLEHWGYYEKNLNRNIVMLFTLLCIYHIIAMIVLNIRNRRK